MTNEKYLEGKKFIYIGNGDLSEALKGLPSTLKDVSEGRLVLGDKSYIMVPSDISSTEFPNQRTLVSLIQEMQENTQLTAQLNEAYLIKKVQEIEPLPDSYSREHLHEDDSISAANSLAEKSARRSLNLESALRHQIRIFNNNKEKYLNANRHSQKH